MVWDRIFGTFFLPADRPARLEVGVADAAIPENYFLHMVTPFLLQRYEAAVVDAAVVEPDRCGTP